MQSKSQILYNYHFVLYHGTAKKYRTKLNIRSVLFILKFVVSEILRKISYETKNKAHKDTLDILICGLYIICIIIT